MLTRFVPLLLAVAAAGFAQQYDGPRPAQPDMLYLKHASELIPTEVVEAQEEKDKKGEGITYVVAGANSPVATPLASPILYLQAKKLVPELLTLYRMDSRNGRRELYVSPKKQGKPIRMEAARLTPDGIWKLEVDESLDPGEYSISQDPDKERGIAGSNQAFCFRIR